MKRLIDWFRKPAIMAKLINTAGMFDGDFVVYKHHRYYANAQTGVVIRIEQRVYIFQSFQLIHFWWSYVCWRGTYHKVYFQET